MTTSSWLFKLSILATSAIGQGLAEVDGTNKTLPNVLPGDAGINGWKTSTILILSFMVFFLLSNLICCGISTAKILSDRKEHRAKVEAKRKAYDFRNSTNPKNKRKDSKFTAVVEMAVTKKSEKDPLLVGYEEKKYITNAVRRSPAELGRVLDQYGNQTTDELEFNEKSMEGYTDRILEPESLNIH